MTAIHAADRVLELERKIQYYGRMASQERTLEIADLAPLLARKLIAAREAIELIANYKYTDSEASIRAQQIAKTALASIDKPIPPHTSTQT